MTCHCDHCSATTRGHTWTEDFRHECEARYVASLDNESRKRYIHGVMKRRGEAAAQLLLEAAREAFKRIR